MKLRIIPIKSEVWESPEMCLAVNQVRDSARKIRKNLDLRRERTRFTLACERIESIAVENSNKFDIFYEIEGQTAFSVIKLLPSEGNAIFPFCSPSDIERIKDQIPQKILEVIEVGDALLVYLDPFQNQYISQDLTHQENTQKHVSLISENVLKRIESDSILDDVVQQRTHEQICSAIQTGEPIGWINIELVNRFSTTNYSGLSRHTVLVQALREYIEISQEPDSTTNDHATQKISKRNCNKGQTNFLNRISAMIHARKFSTESKIIEHEITEGVVEETQIDPVFVKVAYKDGSIGAPFPLLCLKSIKQPSRLPVIRAGLISSRHFEMDREIDVYILRNSGISRYEDASIAEQEQIAYNKAIDFIQSYLRKFDGLELHLYHTGLEPAIIGTYHAILDTLRSSSYRGRFVVIPIVYQKNNYKKLKPWY